MYGAQSLSHVQFFAISWTVAPPGSSVPGILQARILEWVVITFSRGFPNPGVEPISSASPELAGRFFITEPPEKPLLNKSASLVAQRLKRLPAIWETQVRSLGWEDPLEKEMAIHSSILAWRIPWTEEPGGATVHRVAKS